MGSLGCQKEQILGLVLEERDPEHSRKAEGLTLIYRHQLLHPKIINFIDGAEVNFSLLKTWKENLQAKQQKMLSLWGYNT